MLLAACNRAPSRAEALVALRTSNPGLDSAPVVERIWADGPPWYSCKEVVIKLRSGADAAVVRNQVGNWRGLALAKWITMGDTSAGSVTDPGWCHATLHDEPARIGQGWRSVLGDSQPTGQRRRGWDAPAGRRRLAIDGAPRHLGGDSAEVHYVLTVVPSASGLALGSNGDSVHGQAMFHKVEGRWQVLRLR